MAKRALLATPATTRYARYIGRVGALALALGIGTAIATSPGIAWATPESEASDTENAAADGQEAGGPPDTGTPPDGVAGDPTSPTSTVSGLGVTPPDDDRRRRSRRAGHRARHRSARCGREH